MVIKRRYRPIIKNRKKQRPFVCVWGGLGARPKSTDLWVGEVYPLVPGVEAGRDVQVGLELKLGDAVEALLEVRLHPERILGLRQDFQELVVGQEVEPRERLLFACGWMKKEEGGEGGRTNGGYLLTILVVLDNAYVVRSMEELQRREPMSTHCERRHQTTRKQKAASPTYTKSISAYLFPA